ncbi:MAG: NAD(P)H-dependent oxidoreductase [Clostridia bacterium]|nr:NAD(P)H-dependent oxidoreductase [Clostridia bacterium]
MKNILYINACCRENSRTNELAQYLLGGLEGNVQSVNLYEESIRPIDATLLSKRDGLLREGRTDSEMFTLANQFALADTVVIAAPYWDLMFPSVLKVYLENITVCGITFRYSDKGIPQSLCKAEKLYYVTTAGGYIGKNNFGFDYVKAIAEGFFGIGNVSLFSAEGLDIYGADVDGIMQKAKEKILF